MALARPRSPNAQSRVRREGIALMTAVDRSGSMHVREPVADDMSVDRLQVAQDVLRKSVLSKPGKASGRVDDVVGLVGFAGYADSVCPLNTDHLNLVQLVDQMQIASERGEDGNALGDALALSVERLRGCSAVLRIIILLRAFATRLSFRYVLKTWIARCFPFSPCLFQGCLGSHRR